MGLLMARLEGHEGELMGSLSEVLKQLALTIKKRIDEGVSSGTLKPEVEFYRRWKVDKFYVSDLGNIESNAHVENLTRPSWRGAAKNVNESFEKSSEYTSALSELNTIFGENGNIARQFSSFVTRIIARYLQDSEFDAIEIDKSVTIFLRSLSGMPVKYGANVELDGIMIQPEKIDIADGVTIRPSRAEDLEKEVPEYPFSAAPYFQHPLAILNIEFSGTQSVEIQRRVEHAVAVFRLFKVGSVKYHSYQMYSDSITDLFAHGTISSGGSSSALEKYSITREDVPRLKNFWQKISDRVPKSFYDLAVTKADYTTIAYNRYSDSLTQNGILERRIANAMMGLEALFFKSDGEKEELVYRLRMRASKLLGLLGYDPYEIRERINDAYGIRSIFMHGGLLDYRKKKKLESKYKNIKYLLTYALDYLRISIIVNFLVRKEKDEFIDLIDDSFIDMKAEEQLVSLLSEIKAFIK